MLNRRNITSNLALQVVLHLDLGSSLASLSSIVVIVLRVPVTAMVFLIDALQLPDQCRIHVFFIICGLLGLVHD